MALNNNAININAGFEVGSQQPLDSRQWLSTAEMKNVDVNIMPDPYYAINKEDHFLYIFSKTNSISESTGYFTKYTSDGGMTVWKGSEAERDALPEETKADESIIFYTWDTDSAEYKNVVSKTVGTVENMSEADYQALETKDARTIYTTPGHIRVGEESILSNFNWLAGKKINFLGDSITKGHLDGETTMDRSYPTNVATLLNCICNNYSVSGSTLVNSSAPYSYQSFIDRMVDMDKDSDVNVVMGGTNDFGHSQILLGNFSDTGSSTIYGALKTIAEYLIENFPNAINIFCAPIRLDSQNNGRYSMEELVYAVKSVAKSYGFVFIDTYHNLPGWMPQNATLLARYGNGIDTVHPNQLFSDTIFGKYMAESILRLDGGNALTPKDAPYIRTILDFTNYYGGEWWSGTLKGWVEDNILHVNFNGCSVLKSGGGAQFNAEGQGWNNNEYKLRVPTTTGYVGEWKPIVTLDTSKGAVAIMYTGNGVNRWDWQGSSAYTGTYPAGPIYESTDIPLDR